MSADPTSLLDALDAARAEATPGPWEVLPDEGIWASSPTDDFGTFVTTLEDLPDSDAACIVAEHNNLPRLTAALRAVLALADEHENRWPDFSPAGDPLPYVVTTADLRAAIASALTEEEGR